MAGPGLEPAGPRSRVYSSHWFPWQVTGSGPQGGKEPLAHIVLTPNLFPSCSVNPACQHPYPSLWVPGSQAHLVGKRTAAREAERCESPEAAILGHLPRVLQVMGQEPALPGRPGCFLVRLSGFLRPLGHAEAGVSS